jgi:signal transduction histidine kinase
MSTTAVTSYASLWRQTPRDLGFLAALLPIVIAGISVTLVGISLAAGLAIVWVGIPILVVTLIAARWFGSLELARLHAAGQPVHRPDWSAIDSSQGRFAWMRLRLTDSRYWRYLLHTAVINPVVGMATWTITVSWVAIGLGGPTYAIWGQSGGPASGSTVWLHQAVFGMLPWYRPSSSITGAIVAETVFYAVLGIVFLISLPLVLRALVRVHSGLATALLGETTASRLKQDALAAETSREAAVLAEDLGLRQLERDIHDGPQQGLLRIQFDLASAERALAPEDANARVLLKSALQQSKDTLDELRTLSRGLAPPLLQDRGLAAAVSSLAARSAIPTEVTLDLAEGADLSKVERSAYFITAELLANIAKHAEASTASVSLNTPSENALTALEIVVIDDGRGGAQAIAGHGLAGLVDRVEGLRGTLTIDSPAGGPSRVTVRIPLGRV